MSSAHPHPTETILDVLIEPCDVLLFRDGRAFVPAEGHAAAGVFPPPPVPLYGALRAAILSAAGARFVRGGIDLSLLSETERYRVVEEAGTIEQLGTLCIDQSILVYEGKAGEGQTLFPMPGDVLHRKADGTAPVVVRPRALATLTGAGLRTPAVGGLGRMAPSVSSSVPEAYVPWALRGERAYYGARGGYATADTFEAYLATGTPPPRFVHPDARAEEAS
ncbi:MAG: type III-B CRISPR module-associated Cmr3 family protein, partial [Bacteroidota bacterium]